MDPTNGRSGGHPWNRPHHDEKGRDPQPGHRALQAMQEASRRAREHGGVMATTAPLERPPTRVTAPGRAIARATLQPDTAQLQVVPPPEAPTAAMTLAPVGADRTPPRRPGDKILRASVFVVGALVLALAASLIIVNAHSRHTATTGPGVARHAAVTHRPGHPAGRGTRTSTAPAAPGAPTITSLNPASGSAGQVVTVTGTNLFSPDGVVHASFNGQGTTTSCSSQTTCQVTVPDLSTGPGTVQVTMTTQAGTSQPMRFTYR